MISKILGHVFRPRKTYRGGSTITDEVNKFLKINNYNKGI